MANFRLERLYVMLDTPIPGLDPMTAVDPAEFAWHNSDQHAERLGVTPLGRFTFAPFTQPEWHDASEGLKSVRALLSLYAGWIAKGSNPFQFTNEVLARKSAVLQQVESVLAEAESRGCNFYFAARDLA